MYSRPYKTKELERNYWHSSTVFLLQKVKDLQTPRQWHVKAPHPLRLQETTASPFSTGFGTLFRKETIAIQLTLVILPSNSWSSHPASLRHDTQDQWRRLLVAYLRGIGSNQYGVLLHLPASASAFPLDPGWRATGITNLPRPLQLFCVRLANSRLWHGPLCQRDQPAGQQTHDSLN